jgi:hypothetical protein
MNTLCQAVDDYLELRRALGFKLVKYGACLQEFVSFLEQLHPGLSQAKSVSAA